MSYKMLCITACLLSYTVFICSVDGAPRYNPYHEPHTAGRSNGRGNGRTATSTSTDVDTSPTTTIINPGGGFFDAQTTMPVTTAQPTLTYENDASVDDDSFEDKYKDDNNRPTTRPPAGSTSIPTGRGSLRCYRFASDFPSQWISLQTLIDTSRPDMVGSSNDGPDEADAVIAGVLSVADAAGLDPRIAFAMMMQESSGKVRPIIGDFGKSHGLFQVQMRGIPLCNHYAKNKCPEDTITTQIEYGIFGHAGTDSPPVAPGIAYWMEAEDGNVGRALRGYNTGRTPDRNDLTHAGKATPSYVSDVANRLTGALLGAKHKATCS